MMQLMQGDCLTMLATLPAQSVQTVVTSPPYYGLRDYGHDGQIGLEETPAEYVAKLVEVFRQVRRVLRADGTVWLNLGDSFGAGKQLLGVPWRVAFALQDDGWILRSDIIWAKSNPMPESVTDRPTKAHEYIFLLSKSERYFYDAEAVKEASRTPKGLTWEERKQLFAGKNAGVSWRNDVNQAYAGTLGDGVSRNRRTVWTVSTKPFSGAHFATFPPDLIEPCILAGTSAKGCCPECGKGWERVVEKVAGDMPASYNGSSFNKGKTKEARAMLATVGEGPRTLSSVTTGWQQACDCPAAEPVPCVVLDPFAGAGTTGVVSVKHGRAFVGVELNPDYWQMAKGRIEAEIARPKQLGLAI